MKLTLITTGKPKKGPLTDLAAFYHGRLTPYWPTTLTEVPQVKAGTAAHIKQQEGAAQLAKVPTGSLLVALDEHGKAFTTRALATQLEHWQNQGTSHVCLLIGGAEGLAEEVKTRADLLLSLSDLTLPHQLARIVLLEQLYRAATLLAGHPYHRD